MNANKANGRIGGRIGGRSKSARKVRAAVANGRRSHGRPRLPEAELTAEAKWKRTQRARKKFFDAQIDKALRKKRS